MPTEKKGKLTLEEKQYVTIIVFDYCVVVIRGILNDNHGGATYLLTP